MLYIERNEDGTIAAICQSPNEKATEKTSLMDEEILSFLGKNKEIDSWVQLLSLTDVSIIRVLEDLIDVLLRKNIIIQTDLPAEARDKLNERMKLRKKLDSELLMVDDIL